jgi:exosortase
LVGCALLLSVAGHALRFFQLEGLAIAVAAPGVCLLWGQDAARRLWRANLLLLFMIPLPGTFVDTMLVPLKRSLCEIVVWLLALAGYPIALSGVVISIGFHQIQVADACSGLWSMISLGVVGLLYELLMPLSARRASILFLLSIAPVALLTNFLRVMTLVLVVHHFGASAEARVHDGAAAAELGLSLVLFMLVRRLIERLFGKRSTT